MVLPLLAADSVIISVVGRQEYWPSKRPATDVAEQRLTTVLTIQFKNVGPAQAAGATTDPGHLECYNKLGLYEAASEGKPNCVYAEMIGPELPCPPTLAPVKSPSCKSCSAKNVNQTSENGLAVERGRQIDHLAVNRNSQLHAAVACTHFFHVLHLKVVICYRGLLLAREKSKKTKSRPFTTETGGGETLETTAACPTTPCPPRLPLAPTPPSRRPAARAEGARCR